MLKLVLAACVVALVSADCDKIDRQVLKQQWANAYGETRDRELLGEKIWTRVFNAAPAARAIFDRVHGDNIYSNEFRAHNLRVLGGFDMCVGLLDDPEALKAQLAHLHTQHTDRKIEPEYVAGFKDAMMEAIPETIGICFHQDVWNRCLDDFFDAIRDISKDEE